MSTHQWQQLGVKDGFIEYQCKCCGISFESKPSKSGINPFSITIALARAANRIVKEHNEMLGEDEPEIKYDPDRLEDCEYVCELICTEVHDR